MALISCHYSNKSGPHFMNLVLLIWPFVFMKYFQKSRLDTDVNYNINFLYLEGSPALPLHDSESECKIQERGRKFIKFCKE